MYILKCNLLSLYNVMWMEVFRVDHLELDMNNEIGSHAFKREQGEVHMGGFGGRKEKGKIL